MLKRTYDYSESHEEVANAALSAVQPFLLPKEYQGRDNEINMRPRILTYDYKREFAAGFMVRDCLLVAFSLLVWGVTFAGTRALLMDFSALAVIICYRGN